MAVVLHELTTNAAKYGALSVPDGRLQIEWSHDGSAPLFSTGLRQTGLRLGPRSATASVQRSWKP